MKFCNFVIFNFYSIFKATTFNALKIDGLNKNYELKIKNWGLA